MLGRIRVAPLVGAWIEIKIDAISNDVHIIVAPLVGAWIEILELFATACGFLSLLSWERGLKLLICSQACCLASRSSRGSVD